MTRKRPKGGREWMSLWAASRALGRSRLAVLSMVVRGELIGEDRAGYTFVRRDGVDAMLAARDKDNGEAA